MASSNDTNKLCNKQHSHYHRLLTNSALGNKSKIGKFQPKILPNDGGRKVFEILSHNERKKKGKNKRKERERGTAETKQHGRTLW